MISMNIRFFRKQKKLSQEVLAEHLGISRQTITKWENDESVPNINECKKLASIFQVSLEQLAMDMKEEELKSIAPKGKYFFGVTKVGERGQIVIPKQARELFQIKPGDQLVVLGEDESQGIAIIKGDNFLQFADLIRKAKPEEE